VSDLPGQMQNVWSALAERAGGRGAAVMFVSARSLTGTSMVARAFAQLSAARAPRSAWLVDLDLFANGQMRALGAESAAWPGPYDMTFGQPPFWRATPRAPDGSQGEGAIVGWRVGASKLFVSAFRAEALSPGQTLQVAPAPDYWRTVAGIVDVSVVDAPALERSRAALALASDMDAVVLVVDGRAGDPADVMDMRDELLGRGATILGAVVVSPDPRAPRPGGPRKGFRLGGRTDADRPLQDGPAP
jgi:Mrp family chromosome partitioning ATPase